MLFEIVFSEGKSFLQKTIKLIQAQVKFVHNASGVTV